MQEITTGVHTGKPLKVLQTVFGYKSFRKHQYDVINHLLSGSDCFVLMPTGGGKSMCYQIPALLRDGPVPEGQHSAAWDGRCVPN